MITQNSDDQTVVITSGVKSSLKNSWGCGFQNMDWTLSDIQKPPNVFKKVLLAKEPPA